MAGLNVPDQPGQPGGRRQMSVAVAIVLMTAGAILVFAFTGGSPHWINLRTVGVILILAGVLGLALPRLSRIPRGGLRRWLGPPAFRRRQPSRGGQPDLSRTPRAGSGRVTLADDLLSAEHDPPAYNSSGDL